MSQALIVELSDPLYLQLEQAAKLFRQPMAKIIEQSLQHSLPPLLEDIPLEYQPEVFPLLAMTDSDLQMEARQVFQPDLWAEYAALLDKKKQTELSKQEQTRLDLLHRQADIVSFRKGYALVLLKRRGYRLPSVDQLPRAA